MARRPTPDPADALAAADAALAAGDDVVALRSLVTAWGIARDPRIADLVDRVGARIVRPPPRARTIEARRAAWREVARSKDPVDVGRLLDPTVFPGPMTGNAIVHNLRGFPPDPRMAMAFARAVATTELPARRARAFYPPLVERIAALGDVRTLPVLEALVARPTREAIAALHLVRTPALSAAAEATLARVTARFHAEIAEHRARSRSEAELLAEIHANPDDDGVRAVYADRLLERGDPRGELIVSQLGPRTEAALRREAALINVHGHVWAGPLDRLLAKAGRRWERGFLAAGTLERFDAAALADPAWSTLRELELTWDLAMHQQARALELVELPWVQRLVALRGLHEATALVVQMTERPRLRELAFTFGSRRGEEMPLTGAGVPNLEHLSIDTRYEALPWLLATPLAGRLRRLTGRGFVGDLGAWLAAVVAHLEPPEIAFEQLSSRASATTWRFVAYGDGHRRLRAEPIGASTLPPSRDLARALASLPADGLDELTIPATRTRAYGTDDFDVIEAVLARFPRARVDVPWERLTTPAVTTPVTSLAIAGAALADTAKLERIWQGLARLPHPPAFDSYEVDTRGHRALPAKAWPHLAELVPRATRLRVYTRGGGDELVLNRHRVLGCDARIAARIPDDATAIATYLAWLVELLDTFAFKEVRARYAVEPHTFDVRAPTIGSLGWLGLVDREARAWLPAKRVAALAAELGWLRTIATRSGELLVVGASPHRPPSPAQQQALANGFAAIALAQAPFSLPAIVEAEVGAQLAAHGLQRIADPDPYRVSFGDGRCALRFEHRLAQRETIRCFAEVLSGARSTLTLMTRRAETEDGVRDGVRAVVPRLAELAAWLADR